MSQLRAEMGVIYNRYYQDVLKYCGRLCCQDPDLAEELAQNAFCKAIQSADSFRGNCEIKTWLCQIAKNDYISYLRKNKHLSKSEITEQLLENIPDLSAEPITKLEDDESVREIRCILDEMEEPYREVFRLKVLHEKEYKEIAAMYKKTESWARVTYYRAKQKIIETMKKEGRGL